MGGPGQPGHPPPGRLNANGTPASVEAGRGKMRALQAVSGERREEHVIVLPMLDNFLSGVKGQAMREGARFARAARVGRFVGSAESVTSVVRGESGDYEVALWSERDGLQHRCSCPSWREPCKHEVAAALTLREWLARNARPAKRDGTQAGPPRPAPTML